MDIGGLRVLGANSKISSVHPSLNLNWGMRFIDHSDGFRWAFGTLHIGGVWVPPF